MRGLAELFELTHCWEGNEPLHQKPGGWAEAPGFLDQHVQPHLKGKADGKLTEWLNQYLNKEVLGLSERHDIGKTKWLGEKSHTSLGLLSKIRNGGAASRTRDL